MVSQSDAQDLVNAIAAQRDAALNEAARLSAAFAKAQRDIADLKQRTAELELKLTETHNQALRDQ